MRLLKFWMLPFLGLTTFTACENDEPEFSAEADVFILGKTTDEGTTWAPTYYVYGNKSIKTASVTPPAGSSTIDLQAFPGISGTFHLDPEPEDYTEIPPSGGAYNFEVVAENGDLLSLTDLLGADVLAAPEITSLEASDELLNLTWAEVPNANGYIIQLLDATDQSIIYGTDILVDKTSLSLSSLDFSSQSSVIPQPGKDYIVKIQSCLFAANSSYSLNFQCINSRERLFSWQ